MKFEIDNQTFNDLNILSDTYGSESVFHIFKHTRTLGARDKLRDMLVSPSSDLDFISSRSEAIKYFQDRNIQLDVNHHELDLIEHYLKFNKRYLRENFFDSSIEFITDKCKSRNDYYIINTGIKYIIKIVKYILAFADILTEGDAPALIVRHCERLRYLLECTALKKLLLLDDRKLRFYHVGKLDNMLRKAERGHMMEIVGIIYEFDVFETVALQSQKRGFCFPEYVKDLKGKLEYSDLFHPNIPNAVKNDVMLDDDDNIVFLTGSNMAGKSSLLKSVGLAVYLAHIGFPVPASKMRTSVFNGLITTINLPDNIYQGLSHYYSEVRRVKEVAKTLTENESMVIIFDELFRGTNVKDAYDASLLVISELAAIRNTVFFISTHIVELASELKKFDNVAFHYMDVQFDSLKPVFTYKLQSGVSTERLGMYIVENEGIVDLIRLAVTNMHSVPHITIG